MSERVFGEPIKHKQVTSMRQLEEALTKALRAHPECSGTRVQKITPVAEPGGVANWDAEFEVDGGSRLTAKQRRVMLAAKLGVQKRLDLADGN